MGRAKEKIQANRRLKNEKKLAKIEQRQKPSTSASYSGQQQQQMSQIWPSTFTQRREARVSAEDDRKCELKETDPKVTLQLRDELMKLGTEEIHQLQEIFNISLSDLTPTISAVTLNRFDIVKRLSVQDMDQDLTTPLGCAIYCGNWDLINYFIDKDAYIFQRDRFGNTMFIQAALCSNWTAEMVIDLWNLLKHDVRTESELEAANKVGLTFMHVVALRGWHRVVDEMFTSGSKSRKQYVSNVINASMVDGTTPLMFAALSKNEQTLKTLISKGALVFAEDKWGVTAFCRFIGIISEITDADEITDALIMCEHLFKLVNEMDGTVDLTAYLNRRIQLLCNPLWDTQSIPKCFKNSTRYTFSFAARYFQYGVDILMQKDIFQKIYIAAQRNNHSEYLVVLCAITFDLLMYLEDHKSTWKQTVTAFVTDGLADMFLRFVQRQIPPMETLQGSNNPRASQSPTRSSSPSSHTSEMKVKVVVDVPDSSTMNTDISNLNAAALYTLIQVIDCPTSYPWFITHFQQVRGAYKSFRTKESSTYFFNSHVDTIHQKRIEAKVCMFHKIFVQHEWFNPEEAKLWDDEDGEFSADDEHHETIKQTVNSVIIPEPPIFSYQQQPKSNKKKKVAKAEMPMPAFMNSYEDSETVFEQETLVTSENGTWEEIHGVVEPVSVPETPEIVVASPPKMKNDKKNRKMRRPARGERFNGKASGHFNGDHEFATGSPEAEEEEDEPAENMPVRTIPFNMVRRNVTELSDSCASFSIPATYFDEDFSGNGQCNFLAKGNAQFFDMLMGHLPNEVKKGCFHFPFDKESSIIKEKQLRALIHSGRLQSNADDSKNTACVLVVDVNVNLGDGDEKDLPSTRNAYCQTPISAFLRPKKAPSDGSKNKTSQSRADDKVTCTKSITKTLLKTKNAKLFKKGVDNTNKMLKNAQLAASASESQTSSTSSTSKKSDDGKGQVMNVSVVIGKASEESEDTAKSGDRDQNNSEMVIVKQGSGSGSSEKGFSVEVRDEVIFNAESGSSQHPYGVWHRQSVSIQLDSDQNPAEFLGSPQVRRELTRLANDVTNSDFCECDLKASGIAVVSKIKKTRAAIVAEKKIARKIAIKGTSIDDLVIHTASNSNNDNPTTDGCCVCSAPICKQIAKRLAKTKESTTVTTKYSLSDTAVDRHPPQSPSTPAVTSSASLPTMK